MESFFDRYRNPMILGAVLLAQLLGLAIQVKRPLNPQHPDAGSVRLIRLWAATVVTPIERLFHAVGQGTRTAWHDYVNVGALRHENQALRDENEQLRIAQARLNEDANQAHRLQALLDFKEKFVSRTLAAQVVGASASEQSRVLYIDKGSRDGLQPGMAVITPQGIVGKVRDVFPLGSQVLVINDTASGVGAILEKSRLYGVVKGKASGDLMLDHIMGDEKVERGETIVTSGGDRIFPKGLPVGTIADVSPGSDLFLNIRVKPAADLNRLEEVLIITEMAATSGNAGGTSQRAADIMAQRLPGLTPKPPQPAPAKTSELTKPTAANAASLAAKPAPKISKPAESAPANTTATTANQPKPKPVVKRSVNPPASQSPAQQPSPTKPDATPQEKAPPTSPTTSPTTSPAETQPQPPAPENTPPQ